MKSIVVVGNGMVSYKFCERFIEQAPIDQYHITVLGEEMHPAYDRVHLSEYFAGKTAEDLYLGSYKWYRQKGISLQIGELATEINRKETYIKTNKGHVYPYDILVLATGSRPFVPNIAGVEKKGVFVYRTIEDLEQIESYGKKLSARGNRPAAILGGGLLGLEAANALKELGLETHVVEFASRLMPRQLDDDGAAILQKTIEDMGLKVHLNKNTKAILGESDMTGLEFEGGERLEMDMLVISAGIRPRDELARECGLEVGVRGGIVVDNKMMTNDGFIYAIGEVALYNGMCYGLVAPGYDMASIAIADILGEDKSMPETIDMSTKLKLIGTDVASFGDALAEGKDINSIAFADKNKGIYKRINVSKDGEKLLGGILVGDASDYNTLLQITQNGMALPDNPEDLILGSRGGDGGGSVGSVMDFPDEAVICSCESVLKGDITGCVLSGSCSSVKDVAKATKATSGCGGCKPMVADLVKASLESMGQTVKPKICEHFEYSRQELFDLVKFKKIVSYDEALDKLGKGDGCEVCKPALASVFATVYNEIATVQETIQDTNDRFMANIQRNGTYSVVPRVPGGEITPDKLITIGEVAKKYDLYAKITGGQRIDLFGARLDQLPSIWKELIEAGFESGHAYGKALRTVKSCVGSTWCRYGMDESVSFAIELENRYKGIRSPHKLKGGVSGCIRECAEARCKDFGVIAVEGGWNLYVCGNGGANPKHALLLASEIDNETCIKYVDRFLMYYIRTAPPLTRTAAWLEKLDGGIDYLKSIVVDDILGIADELEQDMQALVGTYKCEWKAVVDSPELQTRFAHFANSDATDSNLEFVAMRDQKMPKPWK